MARSVSVKIPTSSVIEMIENKLAEMTKEEADYPKLLSAYNKEILNYTASLIELVAKNAKKAVDYSNFEYDSDTISINGDYRGSTTLVVGKALVAKLGKKPEKPTSPDNYSFINKKAELEKTLKLLKMTDQPTITSSTYNSVLDLL